VICAATFSVESILAGLALAEGAKA
jgi:hypothetical protein